MLNAGFGRLDVTPVLGTTLAGYFHRREADGILDPLLATAVLFDNGEKKAVYVSVDNLGMAQPLMNRLRQEVADRVGCDFEGVFISCTHTHLAPVTLDNLGHQENDDYIEWLIKKVGDAAQLALNDLAPVTKKLYTFGQVEDVAFIRRYYMKDGSIKTNPGAQNPDIVGPVGENDERSSLLVLKREKAPEIAIVNFQVHPDVIGGQTISADYPHFVRDTYEAIVPNSRCVYINGAQGDTNHIDTRLTKEKRSGYARSEYMGQKIAMSVISNLHLAKELPGDDTITYGQKNIFVTLNKGRPEQMEEAAAIYDYFLKYGSVACKDWMKGQNFTKVADYVEAKRIMGLEPMPPEKELYLTALSVGEWALAGFPGEPFTEIGRQVKNNSKFTLQMTSCCANGYEGYFPTSDCFEQGGYEVRTARFVKGTAEKIIENSIDLVNSL